MSTVRLEGDSRRIREAFGYELIFPMSSRMKILFLNPTINAEHDVCGKLQAAGYALLFPANADEVLKIMMLHGITLDLAILHREGASPSESEIGLQLIQKIKSDPLQGDLPIILTTDLWSEAECLAHQNGPYGVNAYLKSPFTGEKVIEIIAAIFGPQEIPESPELGSQISGALAIPGLPVLEESRSIFAKVEDEVQPDPDLSVLLQAPEEEDSPTTLMSADPSSLIAVPETSEQASGLIQSLSSILDRPVVELSPSEPSSIHLIDSPRSEVQNTPEVDSDMARQTPQAQPPRPQSGLPMTPHSVIEQLPAFVFAEPLGDAVVPGGAAQPPDLETFKKYLLLREQDVAVLSNQLKAVQEQVKVLTQHLTDEKDTHAKLSRTLHEQNQKIENFEQEKRSVVDSYQSEAEELRFQIKAKNDKARVLETKLQESYEEMERLKERVRIDIRKIRVREKDLENRLEIMKKDSEALMSARETKIIELKRKLDLIEFNMDILQDQYSREKENSVKLRERLGKAAQIVRVAGGLLDTPQGLEKNNQVAEPVTDIDE